MGEIEIPRPERTEPVPQAVWTVLAMIVAVIFACAALAILISDRAPTVHYAPAEDLEAIDVATLDRARRSIDMAAFTLTDATVIEALGRAAKRGVVVRILVDRGQLEIRPESPPLIALQDVPGVTLHVKKSRVLMHLKAYQVDRAILREGSANFSDSGLKHQDNDLVLFESRVAAGAFAARFEAAFAEAPTQ